MRTAPPPRLARWGTPRRRGVLGFGLTCLIGGIALPAIIEPALRLGHRLAGTALPAALQRPSTPSEVLAEAAMTAGGDET